MARFRTCFHRPVIATKQNIERWRARVEEHVPPPIDAAVLREVDALVASRSAELA